MTLFAFAGSGGFFGASGLVHFVSPSAAHACCAKKPSSSIPASATPTNPAPISHRNSRRVRPQKPPRGETLVLRLSTAISCDRSFRQVTPDLVLRRPCFLALVFYFRL